MRKKILALTLVFVLLCSVMLPGSAALPVLAQASDAPVPLSEEKVYCNATLEDDFADDHVLVVLNNKASTSLRTFTKADFSGIGCTKVQLLNPYTTERVNAKLTGKSEEVQRTAEPDVITFAEFEKVDTENFRQILCLTLETPGKQNVLDAIDALMKHPDVISAEPDYVVSLASTGYDDPYSGDQWAIDTIDLREAWQYTTGSSTVRVGVIDSGIDGGHPEFSGKINVSLSRDYINTQDTTPNTIDDIIDEYSHGTHVAGIIGAAANGQGINGTCINVELVSLRVTRDGTEDGLVSKICQAIDHAKYNSIPILNMSLAWYTSRFTQVENAAFSASLVQFGGLVVCAAGNSNNMPERVACNIDNSNVTVYPAELSYDKLLVVGASTINDTQLGGTNWGHQSVDLFAPGDEILSCYPREMCDSLCSVFDGSHYSADYHYKFGTSMATPYVAGVAALILARYPSLSATQIKERILESVDFVLALNNKCVTSGRLNAYKAVHPHSSGHYNATLTHHLDTCACGVIYSKEEHDYEQVGPQLYCCNVCGYESDVLP